MNEKNAKNTLQFRVDGMDCASCANSIRNAVSKIETVDNCEVTFTTGKLIVSAPENETLTEKIMTTVEKLGYKIRLDDGQMDEETSSNEGKKLVFASILFLLGMIFHHFTATEMLGVALFLPIFYLSGARTFINAWHSLRSFSLDMNVLIATASIGALFLQEWMEAVMILYLYQVGLYFQNKAIKKTKSAVHRLMNLESKTALVKVGEAFVQKNIEDVQVGDIVLVRAGDTISLDGVVVKGDSYVNQASLTGESAPVGKVERDTVFAGTINETAPIEIQVTHANTESTLSRMIQLTESAEEKKSKQEATIDKFSRIYTPVVFLVALLLMILPPIFLKEDFSTWVVKGIELLLVACPCALVISTPVTIVSAIGSGSRQGFLVKNSDIFEIAKQIKTITFDKTGTLTQATPEVEKVVSFSELAAEEILKIAASLEQFSTHPLAKSILKITPTPLYEVTNQENKTGLGIVGTIQEEPYAIGKSTLVPHIPKAVQEAITQAETSGATVMTLFKGETPLGMILVSDPVRNESKEVIRTVKQMGIKPYLLTGDNEKVAQKIANVVGIEEVRANCLPQDKVAMIETLKQTGKVAMIGDGINDAPSLAQSDIGIAMGGIGSDIAMEAADMVLLKDDITKIPAFLQLAKRTRHTIYQNISLSIVVKVIAITLIFLGVLPIWLAVSSDSIVSILVTLNALKLLRK